LTTFSLSEPGALTGAFFLYCATGVVLGALLAGAYWLWARRADTPQGFFRHRPSRATAWVIGAASLLGFALVGARAELMSFHRVDIGATEVTLHFAFPARAIAFARDDLDQVALAPDAHDAAAVRLELRLRSGDRLRSAPTARTQAEAVRAALGAQATQ
jgi:hypothetical protein